MDRRLILKQKNELLSYKQYKQSVKYVCVFIFHLLLRWRVRDTAENQENKSIDRKNNWVRPTKNPENIFLDSYRKQ